jgi:hypothetical protein
MGHAVVHSLAPSSSGKMMVLTLDLHERRGGVKIERVAT